MLFFVGAHEVADVNLVPTYADGAFVAGCCEQPEKTPRIAIVNMRRRVRLR